MADGNTTKLAIDGGAPVRATYLSYGRQYVDDDDISAVVDVLKSDFLTCGPKIAEMERQLLPDHSEPLCCGGIKRHRSAACGLPGGGHLPRGRGDRITDDVYGFGKLCAVLPAVRPCLWILIRTHGV